MSEIDTMQHIRYHTPMIDRFLLTSSLVLASLGCSPGVNRTESIHEQACVLDRKAEAVAKALEGENEIRLQELFANENYQKYPCQLDDREKKLALARALDLRISEIRSHIANAPPSSLYEVQPYGPIEVRVLTPGARAPREEWIDDTYDWNYLLKEYDALIAEPEAPLKKWVWLFQDLAWHLGNAETSVKYAMPPAWHEMNRRITELLPAIYEKMKACAGDPDCAYPVFSPEEKIGISRTDRVKKYIDDIFALSREGDARFMKLLSFNYEYAEYIRPDDFDRLFWKNPKITRENTTLRVPLIAGFFAGFETLVEKTLTDVWSVHERALKIDWTPEGVEHVFRFIFMDDPSARAYVSTRDMGVHLNNRVRLKTISHEIGHVLGFRDYYYETYQPSTCALYDESEEKDLMSNTDFGSVLPKHWEILERKYPNAATEPADAAPTR